MSRLKNFKRCCLAFAVSQAISMPVEAALITVTSNADTSGANSSSCTLRDAILSANTNSAVSGSSCTAGAGDDIIEFSNSLANQRITLSLGELPEITSGISINGLGQNETLIDANNRSRIFTISLGGSLTVHELTLTNGSSDLGGAIRASNGSLTINNSKLNNNYASNSGGAIDTSTGASVTITNSIISNNSAGSAGGGLTVFNTMSVSVNNSIVEGNSSNFNGGGIFVQSRASLALTNSTVTNNSSDGSGGGLHSSAEGIISVESTTISNNTAGSVGGGTHSTGSKAGGNGIVLRNSILSGNTAANEGHESSGDVGIYNSLVGNETLTFVQAIDGATLDTNDNIIATSDGNRPTAIQNIILPLGDNGGPTSTHALPEFSPAINAANNSNCPSIDQRSEPRNDGFCDIGAFEAFGLAGDPRATDNLNPIIPPILDLLFEE